MSKIIFLDIDGVICLYPKTQTDWCGNENIWFDADCVANIKKIISVTNAMIVLTSSWRLKYDLAARLYMQFDYHGLNLNNSNFKGRTADFRSHAEIKDHLHLRWLEIEDYIRRERIKAYIIIDDFDLDEYDKEHFVKTEMHTGLTDKLSEICIEKLGRMQ